MQELLADLLPYLAAFYLLELVANLGRHHLLLVAAFRRWRIEKAGLTLLSISPGAEVIATHELPLLLGAEGFWLPDASRPFSPRVPAPEDLEHIPFERLEGVCADRKKVLLGERLLFKAPTPASATAIARNLEALRRLPASERTAELKRLGQKSADLEALRRMRATQQAFAPWMRAAAWLLFAVCFALLPWQVYLAPRFRLDLARVLLDVLALLLLNALLAAVMLHKIGRRPGEIAGQLAMLLLLPFSALHPLLHVSRDLYLRFHWAALAAVLLPRAELRVIARQELRRLAACVERSAGTPLAQAWERERATWHDVLRQLEESLGPLLADPPPADPLAAAYCPLCSSSFREGARQCADCGVELRPVGSAAAAAKVR
ncbi:MAG TPA: hypothetical protein VGM19_15155 [Armatimonadota bacterium]|jgi:hypothetical protein